MKFTFPPESTPLDGYTIKRAIHRGGFGEVYYALSDAGKEVALKLLNNNLEVELRGVSQCLNLKHPNLVTIFDIRTDSEGDNWIVMEYVSGRSLMQVLDDNPNGMPLSDVRQWLSGMASGLAYLHDRGIVHRDVKPANVFLEHNLVKIGDVGLSKFISESRRSAQTQSVGTVYYMAPEVGRGRYGREVDVYALGVMLYELLTGRVPFEGETTAEILMKHLSDKPDLSVLPAPLQPVIGAALEKDPQQRIADVGELERRFLSASADIDGQVVPPASAAVRVADIDETQPGRSPEKVVDRVRVAGRQETSSPGLLHLAGARVGRLWHRMPTPLRWFAIGLAVVVLGRTGAGPAIMEVGVAAAFIGFLAYAGHRAWMWLTGKPQPDASPKPAGTVDQHPIPPVAPPPPPKPQPVVRTVPVSSHGRKLSRRCTVSPTTARSIPVKRRMNELTNSMSMAVLCTAIITAGMTIFLGTVVDPINTAFLGDPASIGLFALTTLSASWALLAVGKLWEGRRLEDSSRRLVMLLLGAGVGSGVYQIDQSLLAELPESDGVFASVGSQPLLDMFGQPTAFAYMVFFGCLFAMRRWWWHTDSFRPHRFRLSSALLTLILGYLLTCLFEFSNTWGTTLALAVSCVVQLSAVWIPPEDREKLAGRPELA